MSRKIVYVEQFGGWWSLFPEEWRECVRRGVAGDLHWSYGQRGRSADDFGKQLAGPPKGAYKPAGYPSYQFFNPPHRLVRPLDWDEQDWRDEAAEHFPDLLTQEAR